MIRGISNHCFGRVRIRLSIADVAIVAVVGILVAVLFVSPMNKVSAHRIRCRHCQYPCFAQIVILHRSAGSTSGRDGHRRRLPRPVASSEFRGLLRSGASTYSAAHGLNRISTVLATPSVSVPFHLQPRRVRSRSRALRRGGLAMFLRLVFCLPFRIWGYEPWLIFPIQC